nr:RNA-directed DNA polymerase, eukaryota [Tanacetum cinerariifolium]
ALRDRLPTRWNLSRRGPGTRWIKIIPKKINIFFWRALRDRLPTRWNLSRRGIELISLNCPICDAVIETMFHSLWVCSLASLVWLRVFSWLDLSIPSISNLHGLFSWIDDIQLSQKNKTILEVICNACLWSLWSFRNETIFGTDYPKRSLLFYKIVDFSFRWYSARFSNHNACVAAAVVAMNSDSHDDSVTVACFCVFQLIGDSP